METSAKGTRPGQGVKTAIHFQRTRKRHNFCMGLLCLAMSCFDVHNVFPKV